MSKNATGAARTPAGNDLRQLSRRGGGHSRAGGNRTPTAQIKSLPCCPLHHDPANRGVSVFCVELAASWASCGGGLRALIGGPCAARRSSSSYGNRTHLSALKGQYPGANRRTSRNAGAGRPRRAAFAKKRVVLFRRTATGNEKTS